jgi:ABC-type oligopeptide transport system substrate-binding subunit
VLLLAVCSPSSPTPPPSELLAADQTLSFPIAKDVADLDPALISTPADVDMLRNVFSGLYKFDDQLREVPDLAVGMPDVSPDGLTYTFHLRHDARFSNGDPITADDFIYSWSRAAAKQGDDAGLFSAVAGYQAVADGRSSQLSGLAKVDDYTFSSTLSRPSGSWFTQVGLWPFWVVDQKVIATAGEDAWFTRPETLIGSGPFRMTARAPGESLDFEPVKDWYGGSTGSIRHVHVQVLADLSAQVAQFEAGVFSLIGYARQGLSAKAAASYTSDVKHKTQLQLVPIGLSFWAGFNLKTGPFAGIEAGKAGRHAFSTAIDRKALANAVCNHGTACIEATGGLISKGLLGFVGDGVDTNAKFNAAAALAEYKAWDPKGAKVKGLTYTYDSNPFNQALCANLVAQWKKNLAVAVQCVETDRVSFFAERNSQCAYPAFRGSWSADYDHPQDWFDNLFVSGAPSSGSCYSNASLDRLVATADGEKLSDALGSYKTAGYILVDQSAFAALLYGVQPYLVHPYVKGTGGNALYDYSWTSARIIQY